MVQDLSRCAAVGSPSSVKSQIEAFLEETQADELIIVSLFMSMKRALGPTRLPQTSLTWFIKHQPGGLKVSLPSTALFS